MNWSKLRKIINSQDQTRLVEIIKGLYDLSPQNKAYIRTQLEEDPQDPAFLEKCRQRIIQAIYPPHRNFPADPKFSQARKAVNEYKKATGDIRGTIDLLLTYVEQGTQLSADFGDFDAPFYERLETALFNAVNLIKTSPTRIQLYANFQPRFDHLAQKAPLFGWGYGDAIQDAIIDLEDINQ